MIEISITGVKQAQIELKGKINKAKLQQILIKAGFMIEADAKRLCPVDTGRLRASISTNWNDSGMAHGVITEPAQDSKPSDGATQPQRKIGELCVIAVGSNVEYAKWVEQGTELQKPQPYLLPAYMKNIGKIKTMIENEINKK